MSGTMNDVFSFRDAVINDYSSFSRSFSTISAPDIKSKVDSEYEQGRYWPDPLIQLNSNYKKADSIPMLCGEGVLHPECERIFVAGKPEGHPQPLTLFTHQQESLAKARNHESFVVTTGTGSGKSLSFFIPIIDHVLRAKETDPTKRTRAIIIYPMNALANSQLEELDKFLYGYEKGSQPFSVARYTGQENAIERQRIADNPPDILLTNFMMLELLLTRYQERDFKAKFESTPWNPTRLRPFPGMQPAAPNSVPCATFASTASPAKNSPAFSAHPPSWARTTHQRPSASSRTTRCGTTANTGQCGKYLRRGMRIET